MAFTSRKTLMNMINAEVQSLPPHEGFLKDLKMTVSKLNPVSAGSNYYKPSSMNCPRQMYFTRIKAPIDAKINDYGGIRICETGTDSHARIQAYVEAMRENGFDCDYVDVAEYVKSHHLDYLQIVSKVGHETKLLDTRYNISFLCDGIIKYKGFYYILEIKTEIDDQGLYRKAINPKHRKQITCYALSLGITKIIMLYEERNFCTPKTFLVEILQDELVNMASYIEDVEQHVKDLTPPDKPQTTSSCTYCNYKNECARWK